MLDIRPYKSGDEIGFQKLDELVEIHPWNKRNLANWHWKFKGSNPAGEPIMIYAENDGEIIGHFAAIPMKYWFDGVEVVGSHSAAMTIDPAWQNKGLIKFVADKLIKELGEQKIPFTYGYPNDNAYDLHIKLLGYEDVVMQRLFYKKIKNNDEKISVSTSKALNWQQITRFDDRVNILWEKAKNDFKAIVIRNSEFLNWRYLDRPDITYYAFGAFNGDYLEGYCVLKIYQDQNVLRGHFIDLFTKNGNSDCGCFLVENGLNFLNNNNVDEITLWMQGSPFFEDILKEFGFSVDGVSGGGWPGATRPMICRLNVEPEKFRPWLNEKNWYFTMGDTLEIY